MMPLVETLYQAVAEKWSLALGLLDSEEYFEYHQCCRVMEEERERLTGRLAGDALTTWKRYLTNLEQVQYTEHRLCFARGLAMGLSLGGLAAGE